ncbi:hypothetical protein NOVOSPHI9U_210008 [Novosphingobium sp. 9U]|nr:hypothetical protein NOVOSPHI9U_210008 [Novosphingobium sp. 9U]
MFGELNSARRLPSTDAKLRGLRSAGFWLRSTKGKGFSIITAGMTEWQFVGCGRAPLDGRKRSQGDRKEQDYSPAVLEAPFPLMRTQRWVDPVLEA